jgi:hypothetical protein
MRSLPLLLAMTSFGLWLAGCGGTVSGGGSCSGAPTPCGGDLVGTWTYSTTCNAQQSNVAGCPGAMLSTNNSNVAGALTFGASGSFSMNVTEDAVETLTLPASCTAGPCSMLDHTTNVAGLMVNQACTGSSSCSCTLTITGTATLTGTYTTNGDMIELATNGQMASPFGNYCVRGNELDFFVSVTGMPGMPMTGYSVFEKQ